MSVDVSLPGATFYVSYPKTYISDADFFAAAFQAENVLSVLELDINLYIARLPQGLILLPSLTLIPNE